jgi:hypothetical protein
MVGIVCNASTGNSNGVVGDAGQIKIVGFIIKPFGKWGGAGKRAFFNGI